MPPAEVDENILSVVELEHKYVHIPKSWISRKHFVVESDSADAMYPSALPFVKVENKSHCSPL